MFNLESTKTSIYKYNKFHRIEKTNVDLFLGFYLAKKRQNLWIILNMFNKYDLFIKINPKFSFAKFAIKNSLGRRLPCD